MTVTALPSLDRTSPTFKTDVDTFFATQLPTFSTQINSLATDADADAATAAAAASTATTQAGIATTQAGIATVAAAGASDAASLYDQFDDRYLGSKASDPTLDNDGNTLLTGALYWSTSLNTVRVYNGTSWQTAAGSVQGDFGIIRSVVVATAGQMVFSVPGYSVGTNSIMIYLNGVRLLNSDYTETSSTSITLTDAATLNDELLFEIGIVTTGDVTSAALVSFTPQGSVSAGNVQAAIVELDSTLTDFMNAPKFPDFILLSQGVI